MDKISGDKNRLYKSSTSWREDVEAENMGYDRITMWLLVQLNQALYSSQYKLKRERRHFTYPGMNDSGEYFQMAQGKEAVYDKIST